MISPHEMAIAMAAEAVRAEQRRARDCASALEDFQAVPKDDLRHYGEAAMDLLATLRQADSRFTETMGRAMQRQLEKVTGMTADELVTKISDGTSMAIAMGPDGLKIFDADGDEVEVPESDTSFLEGIDLNSLGIGEDAPEEDEAGDG
jgi:hypothetical protein